MSFIMESNLFVQRRRSYPIHVPSHDAAVTDDGPSLSPGHTSTGAVHARHLHVQPRTLGRPGFSGPLLFIGERAEAPRSRPRAVDRLLGAASRPGRLHRSNGGTRRTRPG